MLIDAVLGSEYSYEMYVCKPYDSITGCTPNHTILGCITNCSNINNIKYELRSVSELNFDLYKYWNDIDNDWGNYLSRTNEHFDVVVDGLYILLQTYIDDILHKEEYFYIYNINYVGNEKLIKKISCYSKEYLWNRIKVRNFTDSDTFSTTRKIYTGDTFDAATPSVGGMMDYVLQEKLNNTWFVTYISPNIENVYRTFDFSESSIPEVIRRIEDMFNCICFIDTVYHQIRFVHYDELSDNSNVVISDKNFLKSLTQQIKTNEIITRLYVKGKDDVTINGVNVTGKPYIDKFDYFKSTIYMSAGLISALDDYEVLKASKTTTFDGLLVTLTTKQEELTVLQTALFDLQTELYQLQDNEDLALKFGAPGDYDVAHAATIAKEVEVTAKELEITNKEAEITAIHTSITSITSALSYSANFTEAELVELQQFINESTTNCDTEDENELMAYGLEVIDIKSTPPFDFTLSLVDLYNTIDGNYEWDKIFVGDVINLEFEGFDISIKPRITSIIHAPTGNDFSITVSNKPYFNSELDYLSSMMAITQQNSTVLTNERDTYLDYSEDEEDILKSGNDISTGDNEITMRDGTKLTRRGMFLRDITNATGQMRILGDRILFTNSNWETEDDISTAITSNGIFCEKFFTVTNSGGTVSIDDSHMVVTDMDLTLNTTETDNTIYLNPEIGLKILQGSTPTFYAAVDGSLYLKNVYISNEDNSISISPELIDILNGKIRIRNEAGTETILDAYGIQPYFLDYHKNYIWNSSFEIFDSATPAPTYWTGGTCSADASFHGTYSLQLNDTESTIQDDAAATNPTWTDYVNTRIAFQCRGSTPNGDIIISVYDKTNDNYFTIWDNDDNSGTSLTFTTPGTWLDSRFTCAFDPSESGHPSCSEYKLKFENTSGITQYLDCVQASVDFSGKWAQLYKIGPYSLSATSITNFEYWTTYYQQYIYVQANLPVSPKDDDCWIDTENYTRYDVLFVDADITLGMEDEEVIFCGATGTTITLTSPLQSGCVKFIRNTGTGYITVSGVEGFSWRVYSGETLHLISYYLSWFVV